MGVSRAANSEEVSRPAGEFEPSRESAGATNSSTPSLPLLEALRAADFPSRDTPSRSSSSEVGEIWLGAVHDRRSRPPKLLMDPVFDRDLAIGVSPGKIGLGEKIQLAALVPPSHGWREKS